MMLDLKGSQVMVVSDIMGDTTNPAVAHCILAPISIEEIGLSVRSYNALRRAGIHTVINEARGEA
jgi:DNA-directed RNA polymerase alpha subunit